jgi:hypothetical protein
MNNSEAMSSKWWLATVETIIEVPSEARHDLHGWSADVADKVIANQDVVTVRIHVNGRPSVCRMDIKAETAQEASRIAEERMTAFGKAIGLRQQITGSDATDDLERIAAFLREPRCG